MSNIRREHIVEFDDENDFEFRKIIMKRKKLMTTREYILDSNIEYKFNKIINKNKFMKFLFFTKYNKGIENYIYELTLPRMLILVYWLYYVRIIAKKTHDYTKKHKRYTLEELDILPSIRFAISYQYMILKIIMIIVILIEFYKIN